MSTRYELIQQIRSLCEMVKTERGYQKIVQRGNLEFYDYGAGYFDVSLYYFKHPKGQHVARLWFGTIDDGDFGGWAEFTDEESARACVEGIAHNVLKSIVECPSEEDLNARLIEYGMQVGFE